LSGNKVIRKQFSNNFRPDLYYQIMNLSVRLKAMGINKSTNQLIEEGMMMVIRHYHEKFQSEKFVK
jgi:hypothetical protein